MAPLSNSWIGMGLDPLVNCSSIWTGCTSDREHAFRRLSKSLELAEDAVVIATALGVVVAAIVICIVVATAVIAVI